MVLFALMLTPSTCLGTITDLGKVCFDDHSSPCINFGTCTITGPELVTNINGHRQIHVPKDIGKFFKETSTNSILVGSCLTSIARNNSLFTGVFFTPGENNTVSCENLSTNFTGKIKPVHLQDSNETLQLKNYLIPGFDTNIVVCSTPDGIEAWTVIYNRSTYIINDTKQFIVGQAQQGEEFVLVTRIKLNETQQALFVNSSNTEYIEIICTSKTNDNASLQVSEQ